jgi:hypothetical protein
VKNIVFLLIVLVSFSACKKKRQGDETSGKLEFSTTEVMFDTVFTGIGSATQIFKVFNPHKGNITISKIFLENGNNSQFRINVDGVSGEQRNLEIAGGDSAFIFVEVTINPQDKNAPFIIEDFVNFVANGRTQKVKTTAWGQDAYYYFPREVVRGVPAFSRIINYKENPVWNDVITWKNDKPHVIYGYLRVDSSLTLKIEKGTQVHLHKGAGIWVASNASLVVEGEKEEEVVFQGDRLEASFDERAGQWDRIWINEGAESSINYAIIKNGYVGLQIETTPFDENASISDKKVLINNTIIRNMVGVGVFTRNFKVEAENLLIYEVGNQDLAINGGGEYSFKHCTFANYWSGSNRQQPLFFANNYFQDINGNEQVRDLDVVFDNCIFYGNKKEEIELDSNSAGDYSILFNHCVIRTEIDTKTHPNRYVSCIVNPDNGENSPVFISPGEDNYELYANSSAVDKGDNSTPPTMTDPTDLNGETRDSSPDIGSYELIK